MMLLGWVVFLVGRSAVRKTRKETVLGRETGVRHPLRALRVLLGMSKVVRLLAHGRPLFQVVTRHRRGVAVIIFDPLAGRGFTCLTFFSDSQAVSTHLRDGGNPTIILGRRGRRVEFRKS